ncbi:hypothetical protein EM595_0437 [Duffyella gerundensis]|uniref:Uncharacterized protein n=1 Tax=Duffyella gerundensis TaxID=1619313 RepID=A0A0U5GIH1_9GAMM|nr:hypothetical protein EM595_0437 [Duffyella gerundensis]
MVNRDGRGGEAGSAARKWTKKSRPQAADDHIFIMVL